MSPTCNSSRRKNQPKHGPGEGPKSGQASRSSYLCSINLEPHHSLVKEQRISPSRHLSAAGEALSDPHRTAFSFREDDVSRQTRVRGSCGKDTLSPEGRLIRVRPSTTSSVLLWRQVTGSASDPSGRGWRYIVERLPLRYSFKQRCLSGVRPFDLPSSLISSPRRFRAW
jgi:hypothetical protein